MIEMSFLNKLVGLDLEVAKTKCSRHGLKSMPVANGVATTMIARPKTVVIYLDETNKVVRASAGDGLELLNDL